MMALAAFCYEKPLSHAAGSIETPTLHCHAPQRSEDRERVFAWRCRKLQAKNSRAGETRPVLNRTATLPRWGTFCDPAGTDR
jgi:hypothetical protein